MAGDRGERGSPTVGRVVLQYAAVSPHTLQGVDGRPSVTERRLFSAYKSRRKKSLLRWPLPVQARPPLDSISTLGDDGELDNRASPLGGLLGTVPYPL